MLWYELTARGFRLSRTPLDVSGPLAQHRARTQAAWVFTSATLAVNARFDHFAIKLVGIILFFVEIIWFIVVPVYQELRAWSDMTGALQANDKFNERVIGRVPMGGWGDGADFAGIAVYLASKASRFHTGDSLVIDGGYTIY